MSKSESREAKRCMFCVFLKTKQRCEKLDRYCSVLFCRIISLQQHLRKLMGGYRNERSKKCPEITFKVYAWSTKKTEQKHFSVLYQ